MIDPLLNLSTASLEALTASLKDGPLSIRLTRNAVRQTGAADAAAVYECLKELEEKGLRGMQAALVVEVVAATRWRAIDPASLFELVLSGPNVPGIPTSDTAATMRSLFASATREVLLVGYAVHRAQSLFQPLGERMGTVVDLKVTFCLDIPRRANDTSLESEIVRRFALEFRKKHWPWEQLPEVFYDPRSLVNGNKNSSLHAKCVVVDRRLALVTSANFTDAAQYRNIEAGVLIRHAPFAERLVCYFDALRTSGQLLPCTLT